jgi:hypothetical protein
MVSWDLLGTQVAPGIVASTVLLAPLVRGGLGVWRDPRGLPVRPVDLGLLAFQGLQEVNFWGLGRGRRKMACSGVMCWLCCLSYMFWCGVSEGSLHAI